MKINNIAELHEMIYRHLTDNHPDLRFTLRSYNRAQRLEQGYWFHGTDEYLVFSFWDAWDWSSKHPAIALKVRLDQDFLTLDFLYYDQHADLLRFFQDLVPVLQMEAWAATCWYKHIYVEGNVISAIDKFIQTDKKIIDAFIIANKAGHVVPEINIDRFIKLKEKISIYRNKLDYRENLITKDFSYKSFKLNKLNLNNITMYTNADISFSKNLTCIIGQNGTGKTSLLRAIAFAAIGFDETDLFGEGRDKKVEDIPKVARLLRLQQDENRDVVFEKSGSILLDYMRYEAGSSDQQLSNKISFKGNGKNCTISDGEPSDFAFNYSTNYLQTLFLAFPQENATTEGKNLQDLALRPDKPNVLDLKAIIIDQPDRRFMKVQKWLFQKYNEALNQADQQGIDKAQTIQYQAIELVFMIFSGITEEKISLHSTKFDSKEEELVWLNIGGLIQLMSLVSDGYSNLFGWVGTLVQRLYDIQPNTPFESLTDIPAIVLIDEIDTYLHPKWQTNILAVLIRTFPNVQFVVTTHSPYVVGSIPNDKMRLYVCKKQGMAATVEEVEDLDLYGSRLDLLNELVFDTRSRAGVVADQVSALRNALQRNDFEATDAAVAELNILGVNTDSDPEISSLKSIAATKKRMQQR